MNMDWNEEMKEVTQYMERADGYVEWIDNKPSAEDMILEEIANENLEEPLDESVDYTEPSAKEILNFETKLELPLQKQKKDKKEKKKEKELSDTTAMQTSYDAVNHDMQDDSNNKKSSINDNSKRGKRPKSKPQKEVKEEEEKEYEIEKIIGHKLYKNTVVKYEIKWKGYSEKDNTFESAKSIHTGKEHFALNYIPLFSDVPDLCAIYWDILGHEPRPANAPASKNHKRKKTEVEKDAVLKKHKGSLEHVPQYMLERGFTYPKAWPNSKSKWENDMRKLCAVQLSPVDKTIRLAYIEWNNGEKTIHTLEECHQKCPMQLIHYYEQRLRFV